MACSGIVYAAEKREFAVLYSAYANSMDGGSSISLDGAQAEKAIPDRTDAGTKAKYPE